MSHSSGDNTLTPLVTWIAFSQGGQHRILLSKDVRPRGDLVVFNHFLIHGTLFSNTIGSPTFEMDMNEAALTETKAGAQSHSLPPQGPLRLLGGTPLVPQDGLRSTALHQSYCYTNEEKEAQADKIFLDLPLAHLTIHVTPYGLAIVDFSSVFRKHHALSSGPFYILFSLLETLSAPLHVSLASHSIPACLTPQ